IIAAAASSIVAGNFWRISVQTFRCEATLTPRSRSMAVVFRYVKYCSTIGLSSPYFFRYAWTSAGVALSPRSDSAGDPGSARIQKKMRSETPIRIGIRSSSRRTIYRSNSIVRRRSAQFLLSSDGNPFEWIRADGARDVALHRLLESECRARVRVRHGRQVLHDHDVRLLVEGDPLLQALLLLGLREDVEDRRVLEPELRAVRLEERAQEVIRVTEVACPTDQVQVAGGAVVDVLDVVRPPRSAVRRNAEPSLLEAGRDGFEVPPRVGHVRPRHTGRIPEVDLAGNVTAQRVEELLRLRRVVRVLRDLVRLTEQLRRLELLSHLTSARVERPHNRCSVEAVGNRLPDLDVVHRRARALVDRHVRDVERRPVQDLDLRVRLEH